MRRALAWLGVAVLLVVLALGGALAWVNTAGGLRTLARLAEDQVPGLRLEGLRGPLPWRLAVERIGYSDAAGEWLRLERAELALDLGALLRGQVHLTSLRAGLVALLRAPAAGATPPPTAQGPLLPPMPHLPLALRVDGFALERIELGATLLGQTAAFSLRGDAAAATGSLRAAATLLRLDAPGQVVLRLALGEQLDAEVTAEDPVGGLLTGLAGRPLALHLRLAGPASGAALSLRAELGEGVGVEASGIVSAGAAGALGLRLTGTARTAPLLPAALVGVVSPLGFELAAALAPDRRLALDALALHGPFGRLDASGTLELDSTTVALRLTATLAESSRVAPLLESPRSATRLPPGLGWRQVTAQARLVGTLWAPQLVADVATEGLVTGIAAADAALGPTPRLHVEADLAEPRLQLRLEGAAAWLELAGLAGETLDLAVQLELPRLAALRPGFAGAASLTATARGPRQDPDIAVQAQSDQLLVQGQRLEAVAVRARVSHPGTRPDAEASASGRYGGEALSLALRVRPEAGMLVLEQATAALGAARLDAVGGLDLGTSLATGTLRLEVPELARLAALLGQPGLAGRLSVQARVQPQGSLQAFEARLDAPGLALAGFGGRLQAQAGGTTAAADFSVTVQAPQGRLTARGQAGNDAAGWHLMLAAAEAGWQREVVRLAAPARLTAPAGGGVAFGPLALTSGRGGRLELVGRWGPLQADVTARLAALPLALPLALARILAVDGLPGLALQGRLDGMVRVTGPVGQPAATAQIAATGVQAALPGLAPLPPASLHAEARLAGPALTVTVAAEAGAVGRLRGTLALPEGPGGALDGTLDGALDLAPLAAPFLAAGANRVTGRLTLGLRALGTLAAPALSGRVALTDGSFRNLAWGVRLSEIGGALVGDAAALRLAGVSARTTGGGRIDLSGSLYPAAPGLPVDLALTARNARPVAADLATATIDADLRLAGPLLAGTRASGSITVLRADIRVPEQLPASIASLPNVRQVGPLPPGRRPPPAAGPSGGGMAPPVGLALEVAVRRAFIRGRGLDAELEGRLQLGGSIAAPVVTGGLQLTRGTLSIMARELTFQRGTIGFASGSLMPQLDFAASTTAGSTTLTVNIAGTPEAPQLTFGSSPDLPPDEILARVIFDRPTSSLTPFEIVQLASAVAELTGAASSSGALDRVRSRLGLDRLGVTSDPTKANGAAVEAGRYVAPGLYLGVRQGTGGNTGVGVQYEVAPRLKLEGQTATGPAGDRFGLSYELEY